ncbi:hypothetical protein ACFQY0_14985 [Haloferula chungangensis]|uniref:Uncharacterized protein n=1 Tax=Haloferula chungangensis TaxID=1048331 RepID=A0ABW2LA08_9BACT
MRTELRKNRSEGFTLAAVLVVMAAMLLMAVGVLAVVGIERKTARSYVDSKRAEWVARAGMEDVRGILREQSANDDYLIVAQKGEERIENREPLELLYLARGEGGGDAVKYQLFPLYSAEQDSVTVEDFGDSFDALDLIGSEPANFEVRERSDDAWVSWIPVLDEDQRTVGRYAFWVEDLQGKLSGQLDLGDEPDEEDRRVEWPFPAPGVREDPDVSTPELAFRALDPKVVSDEDPSDLGKRLVKAQSVMHTPDSVLAAMDYEAPFERDDVTGRLVDEEARNVEESVDATVRPYGERPTVPYAKGISAKAAGQPKLNLNRLLNAERKASIEEWAEWVDEALPNFVDRKGGFPDDYLKTLAANIFDYADTDGDPSAELGVYRGLDSYPVVSEYAMRYRWEDFREIGDVKHFILTGAVYVELWNMSDQVAEGTVQVSYGSAYVTDIDLIAGIELGSAEVLEDASVVSPLLEKEDGAYWLPPVVLDPPLQPNEYRVIKAGEVEYRYPSEFVPSPIELREIPRGTSGYRMRWNGVEVDGSRGNIVRREMNLHYPTQSKPETKTRLRQRIEACIPGHSYSVDPNAAEFNYVNNMGDPRMSAYIGQSSDSSTPSKAMAPNKYGNFSPHRRTIRWSTVYGSDSSTKPKVYGRAMPSEWPDGGHNSAFGRVPTAIRVGGDEGDQRIDPDDPQWLSGLVDPLREEAPMRISNLGVFYSACEMGRAYDPLMWEPSYESRTDTLKLQGGLMPSGQGSWPSVEVEAASSADHGGGNTLRIGRAEHPKFKVPGEEDGADLLGGQHAAHLLDLFHVGIPKSSEKDEREGDFRMIDGQVNINTASVTAIRALVMGNLKQDPDLSRQVSKSHSTNDLMAPPTTNIELGTPARDRAGDLIAEAILRGRPFASAAELASIENEDGEKIFGNRELYEYKDMIEWSDSAAEELYARIYESSTFRSRNFRVWVVGQAIVPLPKGSSATPVVLAESRKVFNLFADPGERSKDGEINGEKYEPAVIHENDF